MELDLLDDDFELNNIIYETPVFTESKKLNNSYEQENISLKMEIAKLTE